MKKEFFSLMLVLFTCVPLLATAQSTVNSIEIETGNPTSAINDKVSELEKSLDEVAKNIENPLKDEQQQISMAPVLMTEDDVEEIISQLDQTNDHTEVKSQHTEVNKNLQSLEKNIELITKRLSELVRDKKNLEYIQVNYSSVNLLLKNPINQTNASIKTLDKVSTFEKRITSLKQQLKIQSDKLDSQLQQLRKSLKPLKRVQSALSGALFSIQGKQPSTTVYNSQLLANSERLRNEINELQAHLYNDKNNIYNHDKIEVIQQTIYEKQTFLWLLSVDSKLVKIIGKPLFNVDEVTLKNFSLEDLEKQYKILVNSDNNLNELKKLLDEHALEIKKNTEIFGAQPILIKAFNQRRKTIAHHQLLIKKQPTLFNKIIKIRKQKKLLSIDSLYVKNQFKDAFTGISLSLIQMGYQVQISIKSLYQKITKNPLPVLLIAFVTVLLASSLIRAASCWRPLNRRQKNRDRIDASIRLAHALKKHRYFFMLMLFVSSLTYTSGVPYPSNQIIHTLVAVSAATVVWMTIVRVESRHHNIFRQYYLYSQIMASILSVCTIIYTIARMSAVEVSVLSLYEKCFMLALVVFVWTERKKLLLYFSNDIKEEINKISRIYLFLLTLTPWAIMSSCILSLVGFSNLAWLLLSYIVVFMLYCACLVIGLKLIKHWRKKIKLYSLKFKHGAFIATDIVSPLSTVVQIFWVWLVSRILFAVMAWDETSYLIAEFLLFVQSPLLDNSDAEVNIQMIALSLLAIFSIFKVARWLKTFSYHWLYSRVQDLGIRGSLSVFTQYVVTILGLLTALNILGIDLTSLTVFAGALGVGIGLGLQDIAKNFISGILLLIERPLRNGDWVNIGSNEGIVKDIGMRAITVETFDKQEVIIPNSNAISDSFVNNTHSNSVLRTVLYIGASYDANPEKVIDILINIMGTIDGVLTEPKPLAILWEYGDSSINYRFQYHVNIHKAELFFVRNQVLKNIWHAFKENGIEIPFPQRDIHWVNKDS